MAEYPRNAVAVRIVEDNLQGKVLHPWVFLNVNRAWYKYADLWTDIVSGTHAKIIGLNLCNGFNLKEVIASSTVNPTATNSVKGDPETNLIQVVDGFGMKCFTIILEHSTSCETCFPQPPRNDKPNAFQALMAAAREAVGKDLPTIIQDPKTGLEKLRNEILTYLTEKQCVFPKSAGKRASVFLDRLGDLIYYLDGQYTKIESSVSLTKVIPPVFKNRFSGFNCPEKYKHKKRTLANLSEDKLNRYTMLLRESMQGQRYLETMPWAEIKVEILIFIEVIESYCARLREQRVRTKLVASTPRRSQLELKTNVTVVNKKKGPLYTVHPNLSELDRRLKDSEPYVPISVREYIPCSDRRRVYDLVELLCEDGLSHKCVHYVHHVGGNKPSLHFIWKIEEGTSEGELIKSCSQVILKIENEAPIYERRVTKKQFMRGFGFVGSPVALRAIFRDLTGDQSAASTLLQSEIDRRFAHAMLSEDASILVDLRHLPPDKKQDTFKVFFAETEKYLSEEVGVAVQERRHGEELYLAKAVSLKDLHQRIKERVPDDTAIPSVKWLRYQFQPLNPRANTAKYFKGKMNIKMMVQKRQVRLCDH